MKMTYFLRYTLLLFVCCIPFRGSAQNKIPKRILFVGNSYTYFWNLPQNVAQMAKESKIGITTRQSTEGGTNLGQHWRGEKDLTSVQLIKEGNWDAVVLQDHSRRAVDHPDSLLIFGEKFGKLIKANGAKAYVYMTWARAFDPLMQSDITKGYQELAKKINAEIVPVGLAWEKSRALRPDLNLFDPDGSHPSTTGTYLTACVFYAVLTQKSPVGLPNRLVTTDKDGEKLYLNIQSPNDALFCQKLAAEITGIN